MKENKDDIIQTLSRVLANEGTEEEIVMIDLWCKESTENQKTYTHFKQLLDLDKSHFTETNIQIDIEAEWEKFNNTISGRTKTIKLTVNPIYSWLKVAAAILLLVSSTYIIYNYLFTDEITTHQTAENKQEFILPDKSVITVNAYSSISYSSEFGVKDRTITLEGEAYFDVKRNEKLPFVIGANQAQVTVLGTSFNVKSIEGNTSVVVTSGLVSLASLQSKNEITLAKGESGILEKNGVPVKQKIINKNFNAWMTGIITFDNTPLSLVIQDLNNIYHANISISDKVLPTCTLTVTFDNQSLESVLNVLTSTLDLTINKNGEDIEIIKAGC